MALALLPCGPAFALDHTHKQWDELLKRHVVYIQDGNASRVSYAGFVKDHDQLKQVLDGRTSSSRSSARPPTST